MSDTNEVAGKMLDRLEKLADALEAGYPLEGWLLTPPPVTITDPETGERVDCEAVMTERGIALRRIRLEGTPEEQQARRDADEARLRARLARFEGEQDAERP